MLLKLSLAAALIAASFAAQAGPIFSFSSDDFANDLDSIGNENARGGNVLTLDTSYDAGTGDFTWNYTTDTKEHDGFWLVVSDGENPKDERGEYAILYGDINGGIISAFEYSGQNNANSFKNPGVLIETFNGAISTSTVKDNDNVRNIQVAFDTTPINEFLHHR